MRMRSVSETFPLTYDGIDAVSEQLETWLTNMRVERRNRLLIRLAMEEALLRMIGHIQVDSEYATDGTVRMSAGVNLAGSYAKNIVRIALDRVSFCIDGYKCDSTFIKH